MLVMEQIFKGFSFLNDFKTEARQSEFECEKHGFYKAFVSVDSDGNKRRLTGCPLCLEEKEKEEEKEQRKLDEKRYRKMNIEPEFFEKTFDDFVPKTESQNKAFEAVKKMVSEKHGKIVLIGANGVGKTMLASIATKELGGKIYSMYEISAMIRQSYTIKAERSELEIVDELASVPFLAIDELGRSKSSETEQNWLSYILDKRHTRKLPFMLMSNGHFKKFCKLGGCSRCFENFVDNDILSRLHQDSAVIMIDAPDERLKARQE